MHELGIVEQIIETAISIAQQNKAEKILKVHLKIGEMSGIEEYCIREYFSILSKDTIAENAEVIMETIPVTIRCHGCGYEGKVGKPRSLCPNCRSEEIRVLSGSEYYIDKLEVE